MFYLNNTLSTGDKPSQSTSLRMCNRMLLYPWNVESSENWNNNIYRKRLLVIFMSISFKRSLAFNTEQNIKMWSNDKNKTKKTKGHF
jgi:hypothetical protein